MNWMILLSVRMGAATTVIERFIGYEVRIYKHKADNSDILMDELSFKNNEELLLWAREHTSTIPFDEIYMVHAKFEIEQDHDRRVIKKQIFEFYGKLREYYDGKYWELQVDNHLSQLAYNLGMSTDEYIDMLNKMIRPSTLIP